MSFSSSSALAKIACTEVPFSEAVFFRGLVGMVILALLAWKRKISLAGKRRGLLVARGLFGTTGMLLYFFALSQIPIADTMLLNQATPIFVLPLAALFLKERISWRHIVLVVAAIAGVAIVIRPSGDFVNIPGLVALSSAFFAASAYVLVRKLTQTEHPLTIVFWFTVITVLGSAPFLVTTFVVPSPSVLAALIAVGLFGTVGQLLLTTAYRFGEAGRLAVIGSFGALLGVVWDLVIWDHAPDMWTAVGGATVIVACAAIQVVRTAGQKA